MDANSNLLRHARRQRGWSQEQAIVRLENIGRAMGIEIPSRASLRTLLSMFENGRRAVPTHFRLIFRELYRATDEELGWAREHQDPFPTPPALPADLPEKASPEILGYLANVLAEHIRADALVGPRYLVPVVQSQLPLIDRLCQASRGCDRYKVLTVGAQFAEFCGWLYQDSGRQDAATFWTNHALDYAQELNRPPVIAYIMMRKSNIATDFGNPGHGLGLANAALAAAGTLTPRVRAVSLRQQANAFALLSERTAFERSVDLALAQAAAGTEQSTDDLAPYCTPSFVEMEAGMSWVRLGQAEKAVGVFEASLTAWPAGQETRDRGLCLARLATATAVEGDVSRSCQAGSEALAIGQSTGSARIRRQLRALCRELAPYAHDPAVRELRAQLAGAA
jgi:transcriptional regulator with XRE-family HTH domain